MKCLLITCIKVCFLQCVRFYFLLQLLCSFLWIRLFQPFCKFLCILFAVFFGCVRIYICQKFFITCRNGADCTAYICFVFWLTVFFFFCPPITTAATAAAITKSTITRITICLCTCFYVLLSFVPLRLHHIVHCSSSGPPCYLSKDAELTVLHPVSPLYFRLNLSYFQLKFLNLFLIRNLFNDSAKTAQLFFKSLVSSLDIDDIIHNSDSVCRKPCDTKRRTCS